MTNLRSPRRSTLRLIIATFLFSQFQISLAGKACFDVNGDQTDALPCNPDSSDDGPCCSLGDICLSNGLCKPGPGVVNHGLVDTYRSACTDQTWNTTNCFSGCNKFQGNGLQNCGSNEYCCYDMNGCDCSSTSLFNLGAYSFVTTLPLSTMIPTSTPASASATATSASQSAATTAASAASSSSPTQASSGSSSNNVAIGAGVGVGVGVPLLAALGFLGYYLMRRRKQAQAPPPYAGTPFVGTPMKGAYPEASAYQPVPDNSDVYAHQPHYPPQEMDGVGTMSPREMDANPHVR